MTTDTRSQLAQALRLIADALEQEQTPAVPASASEWLDEEQVKARWNIGKNGLIAQDLLPTRIGRRNRWNSQVLEEAFRNKPPKPRAKAIKLPRGTSVDDDPLGALLASGAVKVGAK